MRTIAVVLAIWLVIPLQASGEEAPDRAPRSPTMDALLACNAERAGELASLPHPAPVLAVKAREACSQEKEALGRELSPERLAAITEMITIRNEITIEQERQRTARLSPGDKRWRGKWQPESGAAPGCTSCGMSPRGTSG
jgi:hypothetical protein